MLSGKKIVLILIFSGYYNLLLPQNRSNIFSGAEYYLAAENYSAALPLYMQLLESDTANSNLNFKVGICLYNLPLKEKEALKYFKYAVKNVSKKYHEGYALEKRAPIEALFYYAKILQMTERTNEARDFYVKYRENINVKEVASIDYVNQLIRSCDIAEVLRKAPVPIVVTRLPEPISSASSDYKAVCNGDETSVIFMSDRNGFPGIFWSKIEAGKWQPPVEITIDLGVKDKYSVCSFSSDGIRLYIQIGDEYNSNLYVSFFDGTKWGKCKKLNKNINPSLSQTHACESPDGKQLYFTSDKKGGLGNLDIYVSSLDSKNQWGPGKNLGNTINTPYNEETPFISGDSQTLIFSSQGHYNMGGYDIFLSKRISENEWSEPQNMGYPINTSDDDMFFVPSKTLGKGYYSIKPDSVSHISLIAYGKFQEEKLYSLHGALTFSDDSRSMENSDISILKESGDTLKHLKPGNEGEYSYQVRAGSYIVYFAAKGYSTYKKQVYISENSQTQDIVVNASLDPIAVEKGEYITIRSILFDYNSDAIGREASLMLERLIQIMKMYPALSLEIAGHSDSKGAFGYNRKLSLQRAQAVANYFISRGIEPSRFITHGFGDILTIARNSNPDGSDNPAGRRFNRRAEIRVVNFDDSKIVVEEIIVPENLRINDNYEYVICLTESNAIIDKSQWSPALDTSLISVVNSDAQYIYMYGVPSSKIEALSRLKKINNIVHEAFIVPQKYFEVLNTKNLLKNENIFTIQLAALKRHVDVSFFHNLQDVEYHPGSDGLNRYSWGIFKSYKEASWNLKLIKDKGFKDAYVVPVSKFKSDIQGKDFPGNSKRFN
jgi:outer membrane protein OmpA-like peptidoglycan-associated protein